MDAASGRRLGALRQHLRVAAASPANELAAALPEGASAPALTQSLSAEQRSAFLEDGFLIIPFLDAARLEAVRGAVEARVALEGDHGGWEGGHSGAARRLCNLFVKGNVFAALGVEPVMQEAARLAVGRDDVIWNAMNFHDPIPGEVARQHIHADRGFFPSCSGYFNAVIALDNLSAENGATRLLPGSHLRPWPNQQPGNELVHVTRAPLDDTLDDVPGQIQAECSAGSAILVHGDLWHGAMDNHSSGTRRVLHLGFACPDTRPQYEIAGALPDETRALFPDCAQLAPFVNWWRVPASHRSEESPKFRTPEGGEKVSKFPEPVRVRTSID